MRLFLVFVILLNILYAGWQYLDPAVTGNSIAALPDNLKTLELLRETRGVSAPEEVAQKADAPMGEMETAINSEALENIVAEPEMPSLCYTLGPFKDKEIMQQLKISLSEHVNGMKVRKLRDAEKHRYWVYIPSLGTRKRARDMVERLRNAQVKDFYIILNGDARNGVSLGHFKEQAHANRRYKKIKSLGFDVEIKVIYREFDVYWLDYENSKVHEADSFSIEEYATEGVSQLERQCE